METYSSINACGYHSPYQYDPHSLHWCSRCPSSTEWVLPSYSPPPPHPFPQPYLSTPPSIPYVPFQPQIPEQSLPQEIIHAEWIDDETKMKVPVSVRIYSDMTADVVFDEMPNCRSTEFAAQQAKHKSSTFEFAHSSAAAISSELIPDLDYNDTEEASVATSIDSTTLVIATEDTKSKIEGQAALSIDSNFTDLEVKCDSLFLDSIREISSAIVPFNTWMRICLQFEKSGVASSLFDKMIDNAGAYRYSLISENVTVQHMLHYYPFDPGSAAGLVFENTPQYLPCSALGAISAMEFGKNCMVLIAGQIFNNMSQRGCCSKVLLDAPSVVKLLTPVIISGLGTVSELFDRSSQRSENKSLDSFLGAESLLNFGDQVCLMLPAATTFTHPDHFSKDDLKHCLHNDTYLREIFEAILGVARDIFMPLSFQGYLMPTVTASLNRIDYFLDVILKLCCDDNCHWVDTGQEQNLRGFLLSLSIDLASDKKLIDGRNLAKFFLSNAPDVVEQNWISELLNRLLSFDMDVNTPIKLCLLQMLSFPLSGIVPTMFPVIAMAIAIQVPQKQWLKLIGSPSATINQVPAHVAQATLETLGYLSTSVPLIAVARNPVIKMLIAVIQGCDSLHCALIIAVYKDSLLIGLLLNHDLIHFLPFLGEACWSVPELRWDDNVQPRSYSLADFSLYLSLLFLPFDPGIHNIPITNDIHMTMYTNISILAACDLIATLGRGQVCGLVMAGVCANASEYCGKTAKSSGVLFSLCQCYIIKQCIAMFFEISEKRVGYQIFYESFSKNIQLDIHFPTIGLALSPEVPSHSEMDLIAKLAVGRAHVFSLSMSLAYLTVYVVPHVLIYAYVPVLAFITETKYSFPEITGMQEYLKDPSKFTATAVTSVDAAVYELYDDQIWHNPLETTGVGIVHCCAKQLGSYTEAEEKANKVS